ncbi:MAG TPA: C13 family peptidase [Microvirga sp.]|nr:C13 family peptidase [Microvirga sp.]
MRRLLAFCLLALAIAAGLPAEVLGQSSRGSAAFKVEPHRPGETDAYILSFGLWGPQSVFESEAKGAARILEARLGAKGRTIVRYNSKRVSHATPADMLAAARSVGQALDPAEDVVVFVLTSHGAPEGIGVVTRRSEQLMTPDDVRHLLNEAKAQHRVVIVSACYSGVFAKALADERTLVITAAAEDKPSFGCRDGATWTYFGDAFFNRAMRAESRLDKAFEKARGFVTLREKREGFDPSDPQIAGGSQVLERLSARCQAARPQPTC